MLVCVSFVLLLFLGTPFWLSFLFLFFALASFLCFGSRFVLVALVSFVFVAFVRADGHGSLPPPAHVLRRSLDREPPRHLPPGRLPLHHLRARVRPVERHALTLLLFYLQRRPVPRKPVSNGVHFSHCPDDQPLHPHRAHLYSIHLLQERTASAGGVPLPDEHELSAAIDSHSRLAPASSSRAP